MGFHALFSAYFFLRSLQFSDLTTHPDFSVHQDEACKKRGPSCLMCAVHFCDNIRIERVRSKTLHGVKWFCQAPTHFAKTEALFYGIFASGLCFLCTQNTFVCSIAGIYVCCKEGRRYMSGGPCDEQVTSEKKYSPPEREQAEAPLVPPYPLRPVCRWNAFAGGSW